MIKKSVWLKNWNTYLVNREESNVKLEGKSSRIFIGF